MARTVEVSPEKQAARERRVSAENRHLPLQDAAVEGPDGGNRQDGGFRRGGAAPGVKYRRGLFFARVS